MVPPSRNKSSLSQPQSKVQHWAKTALRSQPSNGQVMNALIIDGYVVNLIVCPVLELLFFPPCTSVKIAHLQAHSNSHQVFTPPAPVKGQASSLDSPKTCKGNRWHNYCIKLNGDSRFNIESTLLSPFVGHLHFWDRRLSEPRSDLLHCQRLHRPSPSSLSYSFSFFPVLLSAHQTPQRKFDFLRQA